MQNKTRGLVREAVQHRLAITLLSEDFEKAVLSEQYGADKASGTFAGGFLSDTFDSAVKAAEDFDLESLAGGVANLPFFDAGTAAIKQYFASELIKYLASVGVPIDPRSIFGSVIINVLQNIEWLTFLRYFSKGGCEDGIDAVIQGIQEGLIQEPVMNKVVASFFGEGARLEGVIGSPIRELINIKLKEMTVSMRAPMIDFICNKKDINDIMQDLKKSVSGAGVAAEPVSRSRKSRLRMKR